ncbi:hypothetical protein ACFFX0_21435 [Citricoccus parietis]|uniref:Uncharacterized protein n=1 Tax=Citricoccus parietis TaxID=592307 RepID=A0ABV5G3U9_9MICC
MGGVPGVVEVHRVVQIERGGLGQRGLRRAERRREVDGRDGLLQVRWVRAGGR